MAQCTHESQNLDLQHPHKHNPSTQKMEMGNPSIKLEARVAASVSSELQRASVYMVEPSRGRTRQQANMNLLWPPHVHTCKRAHTSYICIYMQRKCVNMKCDELTDCNSRGVQGSFAFLDQWGRRAEPSCSQEDSSLRAPAEWQEGVATSQKSGDKCRGIKRRGGEVGMEYLEGGAVVTAKGQDGGCEN